MAKVAPIHRLACAALAVSLCAQARADVLAEGDTTVGVSNALTTVGRTGPGTLLIDGGSILRNSSAVIGSLAGSSGSVTVRQANSRWQVSGDLYIGRDGTGILRVSDGGMVTAYRFYGSLADLSGDGRISVYYGAVLDADLVYDQSHGSTLSLPFGQGGTLDLTVNSSGLLGIGYKGRGSMRIADGRTVSSGISTIGERFGSAGDVVVTGVGSKWTYTGPIGIGSYGSGSLLIEGGGTVSSSGFGTGVEMIGGAAGGLGVVTIAGAGSNWTSNLEFQIGGSGRASLNLAQGGVLNTRSATIGAQTGGVGTVALTGSGTKWSVNGSLTIGQRAAGQLTLDDGALVTCSSLYIGDGAAGTGSLTVGGLGSALNCQSLVIGGSGQGTLRVEAGAQLFGNSVMLGVWPASSGNVVVGGPGSTWNAGTLMVGLEGRGTVTVADGGVVNAHAVYASPVDLAGNGTIKASGGAVLDADLLYDATHGVVQTIPFGDGGTLTVSGTSVLGAGYRGAGTLRIAEGVSLVTGSGLFGYQRGSSGTASLSGPATKWNSANLSVGYSGGALFTIEAGAVLTNVYDGYIGRNAGSSGKVVVHGIGSKWDNYSTVQVGNSGEGELVIEGGGEVSTPNGYLGSASGGSGAARVSGAGSKWTVGKSLYVGRFGGGRLTVADGGVVSAGTLFASLKDLQGNGVINASGAVLGGDLVFDRANGLTQTLGFGIGGRLNLTLTADSELGVGHGTSGTLRVADGFVMNSLRGIVGDDAPAAAIVTGAGTSWNCTEQLQVGAAGSLLIEAGAQVQSTSGGGGAVTVRGANSKWTLDGEFGTTSLWIEDGGQVLHSTICTVGSSSGLSASAVVTGAGSRCSTSNLIVKRNATLQVRDGGEVRTGGTSDIYGSLELSGAGSLHTAGNNLHVEGVAAVDNGATLSSGFVLDGTLIGSGYIGYDSPATGAVTVMGAGSTWSNIGPLHVGYMGRGSLTVKDGGTVTTTTLFAALTDLRGNGTIVADGLVLDGDIGFDRDHPLSQGIAFGSGGSLSLTSGSGRRGNLGAGYKGAGSLRIADGIQVSSSDGIIGYRLGSIGSVHVQGTGSRWSIGDDLSVGFHGSGNLTVSDNGRVSFVDTASVGSSSHLRFNVSGDGMLSVVGTLGRTGIVRNNGTVWFYAGAALPAGVYRPIMPNPGTTIIWSGTGSYKALGGSWDDTNKTFSVPSFTLLGAGDSDSLTTGERLLITDALGHRVGASFGTVGTGINFSAAPMPGGDLIALTSQLEPARGVLAAWNFTTNHTGETLLSFDVGTGFENLALWHHSNGTWSQYTPTMFTYDADGLASFTVTSFSGYAVTASVPEPALLGVLGPAALLLSRRRFRKEQIPAGQPAMKKPPVGIEPTTYALQKRCSAN